jgi:hypothetical protein
MDSAPILISILALLISILTFYFSYLRSGKLKIVAGEHLYIAHEASGMLNIYLSVSLVNQGAVPSTIQRVALLIQSQSSTEGYLLEPAYYCRLDDSGNFANESLPVPITVVGRQSVVKQVFFCGSVERPSEFKLLDSGIYNLRLLGWTEHSVQPEVSDSFSIVLDDDKIALLKQYIENKQTKTIRLPQSAWRKWVAHHLTEIEVKALG